MSTLDTPRTLYVMDTQSTRVTRKEAAALAKVSERTIIRWAAAGLLKPLHGPAGARVHVTYDRAEVEAAAGSRRREIGT